MKLSTSALLLSFATPAAVADVVILDRELHPDWSIFDPAGHGALVGEAECERVSGAAIHATLPYVTGVGVECGPGCDDALHPPHYGGVDRWLVTKIVVADDAGQCPAHYDTPAALKNSLEVQFYKQDSRGQASMPASFGRMNASRGGISTKHGVYTTCLKVPLFCMNVGSSFEGWTGITYESRPLVPEDCEGPLDFYIDSIKVSSRCPFQVEDTEDLGPSFCIDRGGNRNYDEGSEGSACVDLGTTAAGLVVRGHWCDPEPGASVLLTSPAYDRECMEVAAAVCEGQIATVAQERCPDKTMKTSQLLDLIDKCEEQIDRMTGEDYRGVCRNAPAAPLASVASFLRK